MTPIQLEIAKAIVTLLTVISGSAFALWLYFRQKEYELVKQRYLDGGIDVVVAQLETSLGVVSHNYVRCLQLVKSFRDTEEYFDIKSLSEGFLPLDSSKFVQHANHRISTLLGTQLVWCIFQSALAHATCANAQFTSEVPEAMRIKRSSSLINESESAMAETMLDDLTNLHQQGFKYAHLISELHYLGRLLETEKLSTSAVAAFQHREEVKKLIERLMKVFPDATSED